MCCCDGVAAVAMADGLKEKASTHTHEKKPLCVYLTTTSAAALRRCVELRAAHLDSEGSGSIPLLLVPFTSTSSSSSSSVVVEGTSFQIRSFNAHSTLHHAQRGRGPWLLGISSDSSKHPRSPCCCFFFFFFFSSSLIFFYYYCSPILFGAVVAVVVCFFPARSGTPGTSVGLG